MNEESTRRFAISVSQAKPTCTMGEDCDPYENPRHHVRVSIEPWVLKSFGKLISNAEIVLGSYSLGVPEAGAWRRDLEEAQEALDALAAGG